MSRKRRRKKRRAESSRAGIRVILLVAALLFGILLLEGIHLRTQINENEAKRISLESAIEAEKLRTESIESRREYLKTDDYVRQAAKDYLGLVESGEVVYRNAD